MIGTQRGQGGYTLIEFLVALMLLSLVLVLVYGGLRIGQRSTDAAAERMETLSTVLAVQDAVRRTLETAQPISLSAQEQAGLAFVGEARSVRFVAPSPVRGASEALQILVLTHTADGRLVLQIQPRHRGREGSDGASQEGLSTVLLEGVAAVRFQYYGSPSLTEPPQWHAQWAAGVVPRLVRMELQLDTGGAAPATPWPELMAAPALGGPAAARAARMPHGNPGGAG